MRSGTALLTFARGLAVGPARAEQIARGVMRDNAARPYGLAPAEAAQ